MNEGLLKIGDATMIEKPKDHDVMLLYVRRNSLHKKQSFEGTFDPYGQKATFTQQDLELVDLWKSIQEFRIHEEKDIKEGYYINVRDTPALCNIWIECMFLTGEITTVTWASGETHSKALRSFVEHESQLTEYVGALIEYNQLYKHNEKVYDVMRKLAEADRFQQHCILKDKAYTLQNFNEYKSTLTRDMISDMLREKKLAYS